MGHQKRNTDVYASMVHSDEKDNLIIEINWLPCLCQQVPCQLDNTNQYS